MSLGFPFGGSLTPPSIPANSIRPAVTGTAQVGSTLTCSTGTWLNAPASYAYQWYGDGGLIVGATSSTYTLAATDLGKTVACLVTPVGGGEPALSNGTGAVTAGGGAVVVTLPAAFDGASNVAGITFSKTAGVYSSSYDPAVNRPTVPTWIYVNSGGAFTDDQGRVWGAGSNNNDGLAPATPVRSVRLAMAIGEALGTGYGIDEAARDYQGTNTQARSGQPTLNGTYGDAEATISPVTTTLRKRVSLGTGQSEARNFGDVAITGGFTATSDPTIFYCSNTGLTANLLDKTNLDAKGRPIRAAVVNIADVAVPTNPIAEINARALAFPGRGVVFNENVTNNRMYIKLFDGRTPVATTIMFLSAGGPRYNAAASPTYFSEGIAYFGNPSTTPATSSGTAAHYLSNGALRAATNGNAWSSNFPGSLFMKNMDINDSGADNLTGHGQTGTTDAAHSPFIFADTCNFDNCGWTGSYTADDSNNNMTDHEGGRMIAVGCKARGGLVNRAGHFVNGSKIVLLGVEFGPNTSPGSLAVGINATLQVGIADGDTVEVWMDDCTVPKAAGSAYHFYINTGCKLHLKNMNQADYLIGGGGTVDTVW